MSAFDGLNLVKQDGRPCEACGAAGELAHGWVEGTCLLPHRYDKPKHPPEATIGWCCKHCVENWADTLTQITELYALLNHILTDHTPDDNDIKHHQKIVGSPSPINLAAWALLHPEDVKSHIQDEQQIWHHTYLAGVPDIADVLGNWAQAIHDARQWTQPAPRTIAGATATLRTGLETLAHQPDADTFDADLRWIVKALRHAHGLSDPQPIGKCLEVNCNGQVWGDGKCSHCGRKYGTLDIVRLRVHEKRAG